MRVKFLSLPKRVKVLASVAAVVMIGGVCAGAGFLIYQSTTKPKAASVVGESVSVADMKKIFPEYDNFEHYELLSGVKPEELHLSQIVDIRGYATSGQRAFLSDEAAIAEAFFLNALKNATHWSLYDDYKANPSAFKRMQSVKRFSDREIRVVFGVLSADNTVYYDAGRLTV